MNDEMRAFITDVSRRAGDVLRGYFRADELRKDAKGAWDLVTEADRAAEEVIIAVVRERFPDHDVFAEESGRSGATARMLWLIDPLDGTLNFSRGLPTWGVSVALAEAGAVRYGAFYDPIHDEMFYAERGHGASLNGHPIHTSGMIDPAAAMVSCAVAHGAQRTLSLRNAERLWGHVMRLRMIGSVGTALAATAAGRLDAALEIRGGPWDYAAGALLVQEAGGHATAFDGTPLVATSATVLATATEQLHGALLELLR